MKIELRNGLVAACALALPLAVMGAWAQKAATPTNPGAGALAPVKSVAPLAETRRLLPKEQYPYGGPAFTRFISDSYSLSPDNNQLPDFYGYMDDKAQQTAAKSRIPALASESIENYLIQQGDRLAQINSPVTRLRAEVGMSDNVFRILKKTITKFSLDRGFEFAYVVKTGERQCLLQSVMVAGMLQKAGLPAGVVMVWKGDAGEASNLGHCVALMRHSDGTDRIIDVSTHGRPDLPHKGLFLSDPVTRRYVFVEPVYDKTTQRIKAYKLMADGKVVPATRLRPLTAAYLRSQFDFYRGERAPGRLLWKEATPEALAKSAEALERSVKECPQNPLSTYYLGRVRARMGQQEAAQKQFVAAYKLYRGSGWVPDTAAEIHALAVADAGRKTASL